MFNKVLLEASSFPQLSTKYLIRSALLACLVGTNNQGCLLQPYGTNMMYMPSVYYRGIPRRCAPPLTTVIVPNRPYYFARPLAPTTVIVAPSHGTYVCH